MNKLFVFTISSILAFLYVPYYHFDLSRYYESASYISINQSILTYVFDKYHSNFDFIYFAFFFICKKLGFPFQLVTAISVGLFYTQTLVFIDIIQNKFGYSLKGKSRFLIDLFALSSASLILVFSISRTITALVFFLFGVINLLKGNRRAIIFFIAACFTHLSLILFCIFFLIGYYFNKYFPEKALKRQILLIVVTIFCFNSLNLINFLLKLISLLPFFNNYIRFLDFLVISGRETFSDLGKWDIILFYSSAFVMLYGLFHIRRYNSMLWVSFFFYILLVTSIAYSVTFAQRAVLISIPFHGLVSSAFLGQKNKTIVVFIYKILLLISIMLFFINVYSYRMVWNFSLPDF